METIKVLKHTSGLEFIGALCKSSDEGRVLLSGAFQVVAKQDGGALQMAVVPICATADSLGSGLPAQFDKMQLIGIYDPNPALLELYQRLTVSVIIPTHKLVKN